MVPRKGTIYHSLIKEEEEKYEGDEEEGEEEDKDGEKGEGEEEEGDGDEGENHREGDGAIGQVDRGSHRPFILPLIRTVNDFNPTMSLKVFNNLRNRYQIPEHIPLQLPRSLRNVTQVG